jgi:hypothetical protein
VPAGQPAHAADDVAFSAADHVPAEQSAGAVEASGQKAPAGHPAQTAGDVALSAAECVPAAHGVGAADPSGQ